MFDRAAEAVRQCETQLRTLIAEASAAGDYDSVDRLTLWARTLASLVPQTTPAISPGGTDIPVGVPVGPGAPGHLPTRATGSSSASAPPAPRTRSTAKRSAKPDYPRFSRQRNDLVKTGWSKKDKQEYQHRAPWAVVEALTPRPLPAKTPSVGQAPACRLVASMNIPRTPSRLPSSIPKGCQTVARG